MGKEPHQPAGNGQAEQRAQCHDDGAHAQHDSVNLADRLCSPGAIVIANDRAAIPG